MKPNEWNDLIAGLPEAHLLQTYEWSQLKAHYGWQPFYLVWKRGQHGFEIIEIVDVQSGVQSGENPQPSQVAQDVDAAALILRTNVLRRDPLVRLCILYCPKGPLLRWDDQVLRKRILDDLQGFARQQRAIFLKMDPDVVLGKGIPGAESDMPDQVGLAIETELGLRGWKYSDEQIQFKNTVMLNVSASDEELLGGMKQKTRYNVRLGSKKGLTVRSGNAQDWPLLYRMYAETSVRDGFVIRDQAYYQTVWQIFADKSVPLIAELDGEVVAAVYLFYFAGRAYYLYGMSRDAHRDKMPNYLLQFEAMRWARQNGCQVYDLWGAPDEFNEGDSLWGVFRFKEGLGGIFRRTLCAWDFSPQPLLYQIYTKVMPRVLDIMRARGKRQTRQNLDN